MTCPKCGTTKWVSSESYTGVDLLDVNTAKTPLKLVRTGRKYVAYPEDWTCENGHLAPEDVNDRLCALLATGTDA